MKKSNFLKDWQIAHRGLHDSNQQIPENSIAAFLNAINNNYAIELDINRTKDGKIVCFHDSNLYRMTNVNEKINNMTFAELSQLKLHDTNNTIPLFTDLIALANSRVPLLIEIKAHKQYKKTLRLFAEIMDNYSGEFAVFSFNPFIVRWFKKHRPDYLRGQITSYFDELNDMNFILKFLMKRLAFNRFTKPDFISYDLNNLPNKYAEKFKNSGKTVIAYTAKNQKDYNRILELYDNVVFENFIPPKKI